MRARWIRNEPDRRQELGAGLVATAVAVGVGLATFYVTRLLMARDPIDGSALPVPRDGADEVEVGET